MAPECDRCGHLDPDIDLAKHPCNQKCEQVVNVVPAHYEGRGRKFIPERREYGVKTCQGKFILTPDEIITKVEARAKENEKEKEQERLDQAEAVKVRKCIERVQKRTDENTAPIKPKRRF